MPAFSFNKGALMREKNQHKATTPLRVFKEPGNENVQQMFEQRLEKERKMSLTFL